MIHIRRNALVTYTPTQMFDLVADVEAYPKRFAWCEAAQVLDRDAAQHMQIVRLDLTWAGFRQSFTTRNIAHRPQELQVHLVDGPFHSLNGVWHFMALGASGCKIDFALDFDYAHKLGGTMLKLGFQGLAGRMVDDFCREARRIYG